MRILFVNHTFPPESYAGSELCVLGLAKRMQELGYECFVFYRYADRDDDEYVLQKGRFDTVPVWKINHTYRGVNRFQTIYVNTAVGAKFGCLLREIKPDIVHFHHLTNLSLSLVHEVKHYGCPSVMTLHDYWLLCQRGQLLKSDLSLCQGPNDRSCRTCLAPQLLRGKTHRILSRVKRFVSARNFIHENHIDLMRLSGRTVDTPDPAFIQEMEFSFDGRSDTALMMHPPSLVSFPLNLPDGGCLKTAIAMHESTYAQTGPGVRFEVLRGGELLYEHELDAKRKEDDRGWHTVEVDLPPSSQENDRLVLQTVSTDPASNEHSTAGWKAPVIYLHRGKGDVSVNKPRTSLLRSMVSAAAEWIVHASGDAREGIEHRKNWVQRVFQEVDLFISPSQFLRDFFIRHGLSKEKILFSDNGFTIPDAKERKPIGHPIRFGYIGTWIPSKGVDLAVKAFRNIDSQKAKLIVHGFFPGYDGYEHYESELNAMAGAGVEFRGKYDPQEVYGLLDEIDCLIMPSIWWENSPMTIHEAFLAGVPVLTADVGGMAEQVAQGGGVTFQHRNAEDLERVIEELIQEPSRIDRMRDTIPRVKSVEDHADEVLALYARLLQKRKK